MAVALYRQWDFHPESPSGISTTSRDVNAIGGEGGNVHVYDAASGKRSLVLKGHEGRVNAIGFDPAGARLATAGLVDGTARIWDAESGRELTTVDLAQSARPESRPCPLYRTTNDQVFDVAFGPGNFLATGGWVGPSSTATTGRVGPSSTLLWDATTGNRLRILPQDPEEGLWGRSVDVSSDGKLVAGEGLEDVFVWSVEDGGIVARMSERQVTSLAFGPDGTRLATGSLEGGLKVWAPGRADSSTP